MVEKDYAEIIAYIIEELREIEAFNVVHQIEELESVRIIEDKKPKKNRKIEKDNFDNAYKHIELSGFDDYDSDEASYRAINAPKQIKYNDISNSISRQMTYEEMYKASIEILMNYLVTTPIMVDKIKKLLERDSASVIWLNEGDNRIDKEVRKGSLSSIDILNDEEKKKVSDIINKLKSLWGGLEWQL